MNAVLADESWIDANQALLVAEFAFIKDCLAGKPSAAAEATLQRLRASMQSPSAIDQLCSLFGLAHFERQILLLCAGVDMDSHLAALCAEAHGHPKRPYATFGLAMAIFAEPQWSALMPARPLRRFKLMDVTSAELGLTSAPLRVDERVLHYLAGLNTIDTRFETLLQRRSEPGWIAAEHDSTASDVVRATASHLSWGTLLHLCGDDPHGQEDVATAAALRAGRTLYVVRAAELPAIGPDLDQFSVLWQRDAVLVPAALLIQCEPNGITASGIHVAERLPGMVFVASREPLRFDRPILRFDVNKPQPVEQKRLWQQALGPTAMTMNGTIDHIAEQFRLSARTIFSTGSLFAGEQTIAPSQIWNACRSLARPKLEDLAQRIVPAATWDDLVLPELQKQTLRQLTAQVRHRLRVHEHWGFASKGRRGLGVSALFSGASGTGKTMAAEVIANELGLDLYRVDLSSVVSKYIGESAKNLNLVFNAAEEGGVLLLFDEADALFGKRSEVRDSHDRYANMEVGYLLQRMESYSGLAILTTNLKSSLDKSFQRRLRFTITFPYPDIAQREAMWNRAFPSSTPTSGLDAKKLAQLNVTGGNIRNIALNAAFLAAATTQCVDMGHVLQAARLEALKSDRSLSDAETRGWA
jgi:AAA+ superfamily predicted ATPase